jgi:hypothetical protein
MTAETDILLFPLSMPSCWNRKPRTYISVSHASHLRFPAPDGQMTSEREYSSSVWRTSSRRCYHALGQ